MIFAARKAAAQSPLNLACLPGRAAAVQLASEVPAERPVLARVLVSRVRGTPAERLEQLARELNLRRAPLRVLLEAGEYQFLQTDLPQVPPEEMRDALRWRVKELLRAPVESVTLDVVMPQEDGGRLSNAYVVAAANALLRERMLMFRPWNSELRAIDVPELAQRNIAERLEEAGRATAVLAINAGGCLLTVSHKGVLHFVRSFDLTSQSLSPVEAVRREQFDKLVLELQRTVDVLEHQFSFFSVSALWLAPFEHADELLSLLIENLYLPVKAIDLAAIFDFGESLPPADAEQQAVLFMALGLALRGPGGAA